LGCECLNELRFRHSQRSGKARSNAANALAVTAGPYGMELNQIIEMGGGDCGGPKDNAYSIWCIWRAGRNRDPEFLSEARFLVCCPLLTRNGPKHAADSACLALFQNQSAA
jgi:hypothetical protein